MDNVCKFIESVVLTCFYFFVFFLLCVLFDALVLSEFLLLPRANKDMMILTCCIDDLWTGYGASGESWYYSPRSRCQKHPR